MKYFLSSTYSLKWSICFETFVKKEKSIYTCIVDKSWHFKVPSAMNFKVMTKGLKLIY